MTFVHCPLTGGYYALLYGVMHRYLVQHEVRFPLVHINLCPHISFNGG